MKRIIRSAAAVACLGMFLGACRNGAESGSPNPAVADLILAGGRIHTVDPKRPLASAIAIRAGRVMAVGSDAEIDALRGPGTRRIDLRGRTVVPGLTDAHAHTVGFGKSLEDVDLKGTRSYEEMIDRIRARAAQTPPGEWVLGRGWNHEHWSPAELPHHAALSEAVPDHPVWMRRVDGHAALANAKAIELAGIGPDTPNPPGGEILRGPDGEPTGVLVDAAKAIVDRWIESASPESIRRWILAAQDRCIQAGLTSIHDAGVGADELAAFEELEREGRLKIRFYLMVSEGSEIYLQRSVRVADEAGRVTVRAIKMYIDGALGSRGAWLLEPYEDRPVDDQGRPYTGLPVNEPQAIQEVAQVALRRGWQLCVHAIGTRGNREVVDAFEAALRAHPNPDHRFRIEHAQIFHPDDIPRCARLGIIPSMQPTHATSDMWMAEKRLGPRRLGGAYAWRSFLKVGARIAAGSDFPVESHMPLWGLYAAVTRQDHEGKPEGGWLPHERLTPAEALRAFTLDAAYAAFQEDRIGSLEPGKSADLVVLDRDVLSVPAPEILKAKVVATVIQGETVWGDLGD